MEHRELYLMLCGDLNGKGICKRGNIRTSRADSLCCTVEINTMLWSNYTLIKTNLKKKRKQSSKKKKKRESEREKVNKKKKRSLGPREAQRFLQEVRASTGEGRRRPGWMGSRMAGSWKFTLVLAAEGPSSASALDNFLPAVMQRPGIIASCDCI